MRRKDRTWRDFAMCREVDPELWFSEGNEDTARMHARRVCETCPVRAECLLEAVEFRAEYGIWGGIPAYMLIGRSGQPGLYRQFKRGLPREAAIRVAERVLAEYDALLGTAAQFFEDRERRRAQKIDRAREQKKQRQEVACPAA